MLNDRIARAKELLKTVRHAALATVNADGSPHNSPVFSTFDQDLNFYWASGQDTQHSQNIARDERVFIVLFDSMQNGGGLYVQAVAEVLDGEALKAGLEFFNTSRIRWDREPNSIALYQGVNPQRLYKATCQQAWVNVTERNKQGDIIREYRHKITPRDLA